MAEHDNPATIEDIVALTARFSERKDAGSRLELKHPGEKSMEIGTYWIEALWSPSLTDSTQTASLSHANLQDVYVPRHRLPRYQQDKYAGRGCITQAAHSDQDPALYQHAVCSARPRSGTIPAHSMLSSTKIRHYTSTQYAQLDQDPALYQHTVCSALPRSGTIPAHSMLSSTKIRHYTSTQYAQLYQDPALYQHAVCSARPPRDRPGVVLPAHGPLQGDQREHLAVHAGSADHGKGRQASPHAQCW